MTKDNFDLLIKRGLALLRLSAHEWERLRETKAGGTEFSFTFPRDQVKFSKRDMLVLFVVGQGEETHLCLGIVKSKLDVATFDSRVKFHLVQLVQPGSLTQLLDEVSCPNLKSALTKLRSDDRRYCQVLPKLGQRLFAILTERPENEDVLRRILAFVNKPETFSDSRAMQFDAIKLALKVFGGDTASSLSILEDTTLASVHLLEDAVIEHDARSIKGWDMIESDMTGRAIFKKGNQKLEVITANKRPLEELFGTDLIYFNEVQYAFVMVQYKMMKRMEPRKETITLNGMTHESDIVDYRTAIDKQFNDEIKRMQRFERDLDPDGTYRLNAKPFYLKLVKRDAKAGSAGIILSLEHFQQLRKTHKLTGPRGGVRISYNELQGHYLRSASFADLVSSGYIGSRGASTAHIHTLMKAALDGGRAVVVAIQSDLSR